MISDLEELDPTQRRIVEALYFLEQKSGAGDGALIDDLIEHYRPRNRAAFLEALEELQELCWLCVFSCYDTDPDLGRVKLFPEDERRSIKEEVRLMALEPEDDGKPEQAPVIRRDEPFEMPF